MGHRVAFPYSALRGVPWPALLVLAAVLACAATGDWIGPFDANNMDLGVRGRRIAMIARDPMTALNPVFSIGDQVAQPFRNHGAARSLASRRRLWGAVADVLRQVRIPLPECRLGDYPHQFSGGQRQRVGTAMALAPAPRLLIADEPTMALDMTVRLDPGAGAEPVG